ncbi:MAG: hypothetical protein FJ291_09250 [Planctomycetes bacterium]|nr:hypothetical protein [Planctomycetota bacterium]
MTARVVLSRGMGVAAALAWRLALAAEPLVEYYKAGDVGVFAAALALPADVDLATSVLSVQPKDDKTYLLYVDLPLSVLERLRAADRHERPRLSRAQEAKADALDKEISGLYGQTAYPSAIQINNQKLDGLRALLAAEEAKKEGRDEALIARTKEQTKELAAATNKLVDDWHKAGGERDRLYKRIAELQGEKEKLYADARKEGRDALAALPARVLGRFQGTGKARVAVLARSSEQLLAEPRPVAILELDLPAADGGSSSASASRSSPGSSATSSSARWRSRATTPSSSRAPTSPCSSR